MRRAEAFRIHGGREWLTRSDHMVLEVELGEDKERGGTERNGFRRGFFAAGGSIQSKSGEGTGRRIARGLRLNLIERQ